MHVDLSTTIQNIRASLRLGPNARERIARDVVHLAGLVWASEMAELGRLVADTGEVRPAELVFAQSKLHRWRTDGGGGTGTLSQITDYFATLTRGRLALLGSAGAGKTVLAIKLVADLAEQLRGDDVASRISADPLRRQVQVPVRFSAPAFDFGRADRLTSMPAREVAQRLDTWLADQIVTAYGVPVKRAEALVGGGWILPVLDGVDEMDPPDQPPIRAGALLAALNQPWSSGLRRVVVTCRTDRYHQLVNIDGTGGTDALQVLQDSTVVEVQPLEAAAVQRYLTYRFPDPRGSGDGDPRWRGVLLRLQADRTDDPLVWAMRSPLRLFLAVVGYRAIGSDPNDLTMATSAAELDRLLFAQLVPAVTAQHPTPQGDRYSAVAVERWLRTLAEQLRQQAAAGRSGTDLLLSELWSVGGNLPRWLSAAVMTAAAGALQLVLGVNYFLAVGWPQNFAAVLGVVFGVALVLVVAVNSSGRMVSVARSDLRILSTRRGKLLGVAVVLSASVALASVSALLFLLGGQLVEFWHYASAVLLSSLLTLAETPPQSIDRPRRLVTQGLAHDALIVASVTSLGGLIGATSQLPGGFVSGICVGLAGCLGVLSSTPWLRYAIACCQASVRGRLPAAPARFLDWAYDAGLVRLSGVAVQFRHREFQSWLTDHP